ncbi:MAG TPA: LamG-like jellyroll fold domain-containing protein [Patescibacteria group bacterium]|nr:LamG-like jellyroll fold domain-containing protein [Patescibacteria group bacterium]
MLFDSFKNRKSFTLIELLVVIAVIGLLTSFIIVNLTGTRGKANIARGLQFSQSVHHVLGSETVGVWSFDEGSGTTANDSSGYGNNGTLTNGPVWRCASTDSSYTPSGQGCSLQFDGINDHISCGNHTSLNPNSEITAEAWFKLNALSGTFTVLAKDNPGPTNYWMDIRSNRTMIYVGGYTSVNDPCYNGTSVAIISINTWHHLAWTYNRERMITYLNGNLIANVSKTCILNANDSPLRIGTRTGSDNYFNGLIDEVRIYEKALETAQIETMYYAGLERLLAEDKITEEEYRERLALR